MNSRANRRVINDDYLDTQWEFYEFLPSRYGRYKLHGECFNVLLYWHTKGYEESTSLPYDFTYDTCIHTLNFVAAPVNAILVQQYEVYLVGCFLRYSEVPR